MLPYLPTFPPSMATQFAAQAALFANLSSIVSTSFMRLWQANLAMGEALLGSPWQAATPAAAPQGPAKEAADPALTAQQHSDAEESAATRAAGENMHAEGHVGLAPTQPDDDGR